MAVPCSMVANFRQHIQNTSQSRVDCWNGIANWTLTVTDKFTGASIICKFRNLRAGLFAFKAGSWTDKEINPEDFRGRGNETNRLSLRLCAAAVSATSMRNWDAALACRALGAWLTSGGILSRGGALRYASRLPLAVTRSRLWRSVSPGASIISR